MFIRGTCTTRRVASARYTTRQVVNTPVSKEVHFGVGYLGINEFLKFCMPLPPWNHMKGKSIRAEILIISKCSQNNPVAKISARSVYIKGFF
jgi:hypothetical protein